MKSLQHKFVETKDHLFGKSRQIKDELNFMFRFGWRSRLVFKASATITVFSTASWVAKKWFFPRYRDGSLHEAPVMSILQQVCKPDACFLDIGANVGFYTILAAKLCRQGSVHAFEIDPYLVTEIRRNVDLNGVNNVRVVCAAVWDVNGKTLSFEPHQESNKSTNMVQQFVSGTGINSTSLMIDSYCKQNAIAPDLVKIDVEGAEFKVLQGMQDTLKRIKHLFLEVHPKLLIEYGNSVNDVLTLVQDYQFSVKCLSGYRDTSLQATTAPVNDPEDIIENCMLFCEKG